MEPSTRERLDRLERIAALIAKAELINGWYDFWAPCGDWFTHTTICIGKRCKNYLTCQQRQRIIDILNGED